MLFYEPRSWPLRTDPALVFQKAGRQRGEGLLIITSERDSAGYGLTISIPPSGIMLVSMCLCHIYKQLLAKMKDLFGCDLRSPRRSRRHRLMWFSEKSRVPNAYHEAIAWMDCACCRTRDAIFKMHVQSIAKTVRGGLLGMIVFAICSIRICP